MIRGSITNPTEDEILKGKLPGNVNYGIQGPSGPKGSEGGYYIPAVTQMDKNTIQFTFEPSKPDMPVVDPETAELPAGSGIDVSGAAPGQTVKIAAVDDKGRPTAWVPSDFPESGGNAEDGFSPIATVEQTATGAVISITDKDGTTTATITNGKDGKDGANGVTPHVGNNGNWFIGDNDTGIPATGPAGGYYTPAVSQLDASTMRIRFNRSNTSMPNIAAKDITLPSGANYVLTEEDKTEIAEMAAELVEVPVPDTGGNVDFKTDETLTLKDGILSVNTTDLMEQDNTLPITSAGVFATVGNIEALLKTI